MKSLAFVLWLLLGLLYFSIWSCNRESCCPDTPTITESKANTEAKAPINYRPISFYNSNDSAVLGNLYQTYLDSIIQLSKTGRKIEIEGFYLKSEQNNTKYPNIGFARAEAIRILLSPHIPYEQMIPRATLIPEDGSPNYKLHERHRISLVEKMVEEIGDNAIIHHGYNTTNWDTEPELLAYLDKLSNKLKNEGGKVRLEGNTDNIGDDNYNLKLGQRRADAIKKYLVSKGIKSALITAASNGETKPVDSNETEAGRLKNRRTEVHYSK